MSRKRAPLAKFEINRVLKICLVQTTPDNGENNFDQLVNALHQFPAADLYVLPELFTSGMVILKANKAFLEEYANQGDCLITKISQMLQKRDAAVVCGLVEKAGEQYYNTATVILGNGKGYRRYRQKNPPMTMLDVFQRGNTLETVSIKNGCCVGLMVCNDYGTADEFLT